MTGSTIKIASREGGEFDCYVALPEGRPDAGDGPGLCHLGRGQRSRGHGRRLRRTAISQPRPTCSGARCRVR